MVLLDRVLFKFLSISFNFGEISLSANFRFWRIFAFGEFSLLVNFHSWRIFSLGEFSLLANFSLGEFAFASLCKIGVRFAFASLFGWKNFSLSLRVRFGFSNEIYMPGYAHQIRNTALNRVAKMPKPAMDFVNSTTVSVEELA